MKTSLKLVALSALALLGAFASSCAAPLPVGCLYTDITLPGALGDGNIGKSANRHGSASCYSILGWVAAGDASINEAAYNGDVDKISWTSFHATNYFGIYGIYRTDVYGTSKALGPDQTLAPFNPEKK